MRSRGRESIVRIIVERHPPSSRGLCGPWPSLQSRLRFSWATPAPPPKLAWAAGIGAEAERIKQDAVDQLVRIGRGESALASKLLAEGHSIVDLLFGSDAIGHLIASPADNNPLTISQLREAFIDNLNATGRTPGHIDGARGHLDHFIRVLGGVRVVSLTDADMAAFQNKRGKEKTAGKARSWLISDGAHPPRTESRTQILAHGVGHASLSDKRGPLRFDALRFNLESEAKYTSPMPPAPRGERIS